MATTVSIAQFSAHVFLVIFFANSQVLTSASHEPSPVSATPAVLPYVTAPDISSFFPTPRAGGVDAPASFAASPEAEPPAPTSGDFVGKRSSSSTRLDCAAFIVGLMLISCFLLTSRIV